MSEPANHRIERKIAQARLALAFERLWSALLWPLTCVAVFVTLVLSGLLPRLPDALRYAVLVAWVASLLWSLRHAVKFAMPRRAEAIRRLEQASNLSHRPVATLDDTLAEGSGSEALWQEYKLRQLQRLGTVKAGTPQSDWRDKDPLALRVPVVLALVVSLVLGSGSLRSNLADSLRVVPLGAPAVVSIDAWLKPPAYTGRPPVLLTSPAMAEKLAVDKDILVPENAMLTLRTTGVAAPQLDLVNEDNAPLANVKPKQATTGNVWQAEAKITRPLVAKLMDSSQEVARWHITVIPDAAPTVSVSGTPSSDASGTLTLKWKTADDYGVTGLASEISLSDEQEEGLGFSSSGIFLFDPPQLAVTLRRASPKQEDGTTTASLAEHAWAGFMVEITLTAKDAAGHETASKPVRFKLPERMFLKPLAQALIEQRKRLILDPETAPDVSKLLQALLIYPEGLIERSGTHLAIATIVSRLDNAQSTDDVVDAIKGLWQIAVNVEDGSAADARAELEALRKELEKALAEGASPERIQQLMDKMRKAMDRYMQSLAEEQRKSPMQNSPQAGGQSITPRDLQKMLDDIEKLSKSGDKDAARQMLSQLDEILRNLKPGQSQQGGEGDPAMGKLLDDLTRLMQKQQGLMDDTQRMPGPNDEQPPQEGNQASPDGLGNRQQDLGKSLSDMMKELGQQGLEGPSQFGDAGREMKNAEGALRQGDREGALGRQGQAMAKLREGMRSLLRQMMQQGQGQNRSGAQGQASGNDRDPLGRPRASRGEDYGPDRNMIPSERAMRRAQEILDQLRSRSNLPDLAKPERDYIERLLRGLY